MYANGAGAPLRGGAVLENKTVWPLLWVALTGWLLYLLSPILTPFIVAALLAYLGDPLVDRLETWRLPRTLQWPIR